MKAELDKMLAENIIRPSTSPWASPIVLVPKKDGEVRFCVDYRKVNQVAKIDSYPMPRVEEVFEGMGDRLGCVNLRPCQRVLANPSDS